MAVKAVAEGVDTENSPAPRERSPAGVAAKSSVRMGSMEVAVAKQTMKGESDNGSGSRDATVASQPVPNSCGRYASLGGAKTRSLPGGHTLAFAAGSEEPWVHPTGERMRVVALSPAMRAELWLVPCWLWLGSLLCKPQPPFFYPSLPWHGLNSD